MANVSSFSGAMPVIPGGLVETGYVQRTTNYTSTATTIAAATSAFTDLTFIADGGPYMVEVFFPQVSFTGAYTLGCFVNAAGTDIGQIIYVGPTSASHGAYGSYRYTPSAGATTINFRAATNTGTATYSGGAGGTGAYPPSFLRVSKIVNQNNGLKPFWTPPIVTQLPTNPRVGDQVIYAADATNGVYWYLTYDGLGTYPWKFIGGTPLIATQGSGGQTSSSTYQTTNIPSISAPLSGDYVATFGGYAQKATATVGAADMTFGLHLNSSVQSTATETASTQNDGGTPATTVRVNGASAGQAFDVRWKSSASLNAAFSAIRLTITPIRVSN